MRDHVRYLAPAIQQEELKVGDLCELEEYYTMNPKRHVCIYAGLSEEPGAFLFIFPDNPTPRGLTGVLHNFVRVIQRASETRDDAL